MGLQVIDGKMTNWCGLWFHNDTNAFSSSVIDLADLRKFKGKVRLYVRKNKFFNKGENNRPNYNFCLRDANSDVFTELKVTLDDYKNVDGFEANDLLNVLLEDKDIDEIIEIIRDIKGERLYTGYEVEAVMHGVTRDVERGYTDNLISDYV